MKKILWLLIVVLFFGSLARTNAQVFTNPIPPQINVPNQIWRNFRMGQIGSQMAADMARSKQANKNSTTTKKKAADVSKLTANNSAIYQKQFAFVRTEESLLAQEIIKAQKGNSNDLVKMRQLVNYMWSNYELSFADENRRLKMPFNDVVTALTYYIVLSYIYAKDLASLDSENSVAVYKQVADIMSKDADFARLQPVDKQLFAELLIMMGGMPGAAYEKNRNKTEQMKLGQANLERIFGAQAKNLQITSNGIEF